MNRAASRHSDATTSARRSGPEGRRVPRAGAPRHPNAATRPPSHGGRCHTTARSAHALAPDTLRSTHQESKAHSHVPPRFRSTEFYSIPRENRVIWP